VAREQMVADILAAGRRHLATHGAAALSLRAVARDLGLVSSAVYRYVPSRDDLLTRLLIQGYDELGQTVEDVAQASRRRTPARQWLALAQATRTWALGEPQMWALLYGSPVPGYAAPTDTIDPATRLPRALITLVIAHRPTLDDQAPSPKLQPLLTPIRDQIPPGALSDELIMRALMAWSQVIGSVSFELFGHRKGAVTDYAQYFEQEQLRLAAYLGLG
jgi:AcrR family transcriptional regulator